MRPARDLGHDAAEARMEVDLARDDRRHDVPTVVDDRGRGLVARRLDAQDPHSFARRAPRRAHRPVLEDGLAGDGRLDAIEQLGVVGRVDLVDPHHQRVLAGLLVVVLADADGSEPESPVEELRARVREPNLEREVPRVAGERLVRETEHETRPDPVPVPCRVDGDRRDVPVLAAQHETRVPDDVATDASHEVRARAAQRQLREEQRMAPWARIHLLLDAQHRAQMAPPHRGDLHGERWRHRHPRTPAQLSSASLSRR